MIPTYFNIADSQKCLMNLRAFFITDFKSSILVQPRDTTLNNPTIYSRTLPFSVRLWLACCSLFNRVWGILSHIPAFCHSCSLLHQIIPHPIIVLRMNKISVRASLLVTGFRPGYPNVRFLFGSIGSIISHNLPSSVGFAMSNLHVFGTLMLSVINLIFFHFVRGSKLPPASFFASNKRTPPQNCRTDSPLACHVSKAIRQNCC